MCICVDKDPLVCKAKRYGYSPAEFEKIYYHYADCGCSCHKSGLTTVESESVVQVAQMMGFPYAVEVPMLGAHIDLVQSRSDGLFCLEFKFKKWQSCIQQARMHKLYSRWSIVVMNKVFDKAVDICKQEGLGYAVFGVDGSFSEILAPVNQDISKYWERVLRERYDLCCALKQS